MLGHQGFTPTGTLTCKCRKLCHRGRLEHGPNCEIGIQTGVDRIDQPHRRERVATQVEERIIRPDSFQTEYLRINAGQHFFDGSRRSTVLLTVGVVGGRQSALVEFAVDRQGQRLEHHHRRGHHVAGQPLRQCRTNGDRVRTASDVADQALVAGAIFSRYHLGLSHSVQIFQRGLDFAQFDAVSADLDLLISTPQIAQLAVGTPSCEIAGPIHPGPCPAERARHKPRRTQSTATPVAESQPGADHVQLTHHTDRHRSQRRVQHEEPEVRQRHTDRARAALNVTGHDLPERGVHGRLGDAIHVDQPSGT